MLYTGWPKKRETQKKHPGRILCFLFFGTTLYKKIWEQIKVTLSFILVKWSQDFPFLSNPASIVHLPWHGRWPSVINKYYGLGVVFPDQLLMKCVVTRVLNLEWSSELWKRSSNSQSNFLWTDYGSFLSYLYLLAHTVVVGACLWQHWKIIVSYSIHTHLIRVWCATREDVTRIWLKSTNCTVVDKTKK